MPPPFLAFCAGSNPERSSVIDAEMTVNLFRATVETEGAPKPAYLLGTPGLRRLGGVSGGTKIGRGLFTQDAQTFTVIGDQLLALTLDPTTGSGLLTTVLGTVGDDRRPVSWATNGDGGTQLAIVSAGRLYILNLVTRVLTGPVALPLTQPPQFIGYMDGYFVLSELGSIRFWFSAIENGLSWDALDFVSRSTASDQIAATICANSRVWVFGTETTEAYEDVGDADNPFQPIKGSLFQIGLAAPYSISLGVQTMRWLGRSANSGAAVYRLDGYNGTRVSTHAIEQTIAQATTLADAEGLTYSQEGHLFYALTIPSIAPAGDTVVLDELEHVWHHRRAWDANAGQEEAWRVRGHAYVGRVHLVGSRDGGELWALDLDTYDDDGRILRARRRAPYMGADNVYASIDAFELGVENGVGLNSGQGANPQVYLRLSRDGGKTWASAGAGATTWSVPGTAPLGAMGHYGDRTYWTQLGQARIDRLVFEVVITDAVKRVIGPGAWVKATPGRAA